MKITLHDATVSLQGRKEFAVKHYGNGLVSINYLVCLPDTFDGIRSEFRGITFDSFTGQCISRPFHKFYNVNQKPETMWGLLRNMKATVWEKVDGSMVHFFWRKPNGVMCSTRSSADTEQALKAADLAKSDKVTHSLILSHLAAGFTPIFEYVAPDNQIVVRYPKPRLVYLHSRHIEDGHYWFDDRFPDRARHYDMPLVDCMDHLDQPECEGLVAQMENGLWVKAKGKWYLDRHRVVGELMRPAYKLYEMALAGDMDDIYANAAEHHKPVLKSIMEEAAGDFLAMRNSLLQMHKEIHADIHWAKHDNRKQYVRLAQERWPNHFGGLMSVYDGKEPSDFIRRRLMERYTLEKTGRPLSDVE